MSKKISASVAAAIIIIAMALTFSVTWIVSMQVFNRTVSAVTRLQAQYTKLAEIDTYVRNNYYRDIDNDYLFDRVAAGYLNGLNDRYCTYYTASEYADMLAIEEGRLVGVGIELVNDADGSYRIVYVHPNSPAERVGITKNLRISAIDNVAIADFANIAAINRALMGEEGTQLNLSCIENVADEVDFTIQRIQYKKPTVQYEMLEGGYAYVRISAFTTETFTEFDYVVRRAISEGAAAFVFDVRANNGGQFRNAYNMIDMLCPLGTIAKRENRDGTMQTVRTSDENSVNLPMVVLVNERTSAAAELFAISVRDMAGGQIVGMRTVGRNTMQDLPFRLADGSAIVLTVARLWTGSDETFAEGITPDIIAEGEGVSEEMLLNIQPGADPQILRALEAARAMVRVSGNAAPPPNDNPPESGSMASSG